MTSKPTLSPAAIEHRNRIAAARGQPPPVVKRESVYVHTTECEHCRKVCPKSYRTKENEWLCNKCGNEHLDQCARRSK